MTDPIKITEALRELQAAETSEGTSEHAIHRIKLTISDLENSDPQSALWRLRRLKTRQDLSGFAMGHVIRATMALCGQKLP